MNLFCEAKAKQAAEKNRQILEHCVLDKISLYFTNLYLNIYIIFKKKKNIRTSILYSDGILTVSKISLYNALNLSLKWVVFCFCKQQPCFLPFSEKLEQFTGLKKTPLDSHLGFVSVIAVQMNVCSLLYNFNKAGNRD